MSGILFLGVEMAMIPIPCKLPVPSVTLWSTLSATQHQVGTLQASYQGFHFFISVYLIITNGESCVSSSTTKTHGPSQHQHQIK